MPFGSILPFQTEHVRQHVRGRSVHDLGCGHDLFLSFELIDLGATKVTAIDTYSVEQIEKPKTSDRVTYVRNVFECINEPIDVAFVSWPSSHYSPGLLRLVSSASVVIYLGTCVDGLLCGSPELFRYLATREVLAHEPHRYNTLIVYGPQRENRSWLPEELAGIDLSRIYYFNEAYRSKKTGT